MSKALRRLRRACFLAAALLLAAALVVPTFASAASDPDADRPIVWSGQGTAQAVIATADSKNGVLPVQQPFFAGFPDAATQFDTGSQYARASTYFPGPTGVGGAALACDQALSQVFAPGRLPPNLDDPICKPPPPFPTVAQADSTTPDGRVSGSQELGQGGPLTIEATSAVAHADRTSVYGDAALGAVNVAGTSATAPTALAFRRQAASILHGPAAAAAVKAAATDNSALHIDSAVAHSKQIYDTDGALVVVSTSTLKGVSLAGGAIQIASIKTDTKARTDGRGIAEHAEHFTLEGVTVSGQPAAIDETGVHVGGSSSSAKPLTDALNSALAAMHAKVALASISGDVKSGDPKTVASEVQGLNFYIEQFLPIPNATDTYFATFTLGVAGSTATASNARNGESPPEEGGIGGVSVPPDTGSAAAPVDTGTPSFAAGATPSSGGGTFNSVIPGRPGRAAVLGNRRTGFLNQLESDLIGATISHRFDLLYLAVAIAFVGVCLSSRLLVPRPRQLPGNKVY